MLRLRIRGAKPPLATGLHYVLLVQQRDNFTFVLKNVCMVRRKTLKTPGVNHVMKTNLTHNLSSVYFVNQPLHVSGIFVAHHQEVYCMYTIGMCCAFQLTVC